jgi:flagellin
MSFSINTNVGALTANLNSSSANSAMGRTLSALSNGSALNSASYDAAGLAIANQMSAQVSGMGQGIMNSNDSIGMIQIADGAMQGINDNLERIRTLTLQASNGTLTSSDRAIIQKEIDSLLESNNDIAKTTSYNGINLLDGTGGSNGDGTFTTQSGADEGNSISFTIGDATMDSLLASVDVTTQAGRDAALGDIDSAMNTISGISADLGASQNAHMSSIRNTSVTQINVAAAESQIRDIDFALESMNFSQQNIMSQIGSFAQSQSNAAQANVLNLLQ